MMNYDENLLDVLELVAEFLPLIIPVLLIQWTLMIYALVKLLRSEAEPKFLPKWVWVIIILLVNIIGPVVYLMIGRKDE
ncbi:MAG: PLDc N-terminal domain-containing protein [Eubacteriales bacterium]|nr:PLDc N-terminal domain-containing protein [Eubacteriales bacterium]MDD4327974.1 PLDc N-terminal domain-containing protein [Eubacteriales bacterium]MDD4716876.1 PLDc N-terminal domain-containing protein [Eubacteriales bacterium]